MKSSEKSVTLTHKTITNAFYNKQQLALFGKNKTRTIPKNKNGEQSYLSIDMTPKKFKKRSFYPRRTSFTTDKALTKNILD